jgi:ATPase family associated with various cellular activities (AAA)
MAGILGWIFGTSSHEPTTPPVAKAAPKNHDEPEDFLAKVRSHSSKLAASKLNEVFNPSRPIARKDALAGREPELMASIRKLMSPGNHVLLYGDRGVGKSSLGYVVIDIFKQLPEFSGYRFEIYRCDSSSTLSSIFAGPLRTVGHDVSVHEVVSTGTADTKKGFNPTLEFEAGGMQVNLGLGGVASHTTNGTSQRRSGAAEFAQSARWIADEISDSKVLLFIDELDKVHSNEVKHGIATILKHASDKPGANFKCLLGGIAQNAAELTASHPSVQRCLTEMRIGQLEEKFLVELLTKGEARISIQTARGIKPLKFSEPIKKEIASKSFGYPYFTHLIAQAAGVQAIETGNELVGSTEELRAAIDTAVTGAEASLKDALAHAVAGDEHGVFHRLLIAAAEFHAPILSAAEWRNQYEIRWGRQLSNAQLVPYLKRLVVDKDKVPQDGTNGLRLVFVRESSGLFRFYDPRMPSFIRLALSGAVNGFARVGPDRSEGTSVEAVKFTA